MGIGADRYCILACLQDITAILDLDAFRIIGRHVFLRDLKGNLCGSPGL